eukprot:scaffold6348_cov259-Pinguiococcus_pyrenoidosus.AAC.15
MLGDGVEAEVEAENHASRSGLSSSSRVPSPLAQTVDPRRTLKYLHHIHKGRPASVELGSLLESLKEFWRLFFAVSHADWVSSASAPSGYPVARRGAHEAQFSDDAGRAERFDGGQKPDRGHHRTNGRREIQPGPPPVSIAEWTLDPTKPGEKLRETPDRCSRLTRRLRSKEEQDRVRHHCLDIRNVDEDSDAAVFYKAAFEAIDDIIERGKLPVVVGGTMMYLDW